MSRIENALKAATETKALRIGSGIIGQVPGLFREQFPGRKAVVVADNNTYRVAGERVHYDLKTAGIIYGEPFVFRDPDLYAEYSFVDQLTAVLKLHDAIPVAVGSDTINDLVKLSSHLTGRPYLCVATAASVDGYTAYGASKTAGGAKLNFDCPAPGASLADIGILSHAPAEMTASGYGDLFAKVTAGADWILADRLGEEAIDSQAWSIVQGGLNDALSDPQGIASGNHEAVSKLTEGLMLGGFAMQWLKSSRPGSGAEHQFSHLWNMEHFLNNGERVSHGFQVSLGTLAVTALYEQVLKTPLGNLDVAKCCRNWPTAEESDAKTLQVLAGTGFSTLGLAETRAKYITGETLERQLRECRDSWPEIRSRLAGQLVPYGEAKRRLQLAGAPTEPEQIGMTRRYLRESFIRAWCIRRRFTVLDLAVRTDYLNEWLNQLFSGGGIWEIYK